MVVWEIFRTFAHKSIIRRTGKQDENNGNNNFSNDIDDDDCV